MEQTLLYNQEDSYLIEELYVVKIETTKPKILLVDDDENLLLSLKRNLRKEYAVFCSLSGEEGLERLQIEEFAVVVSDFQMPGMNGIAFLQMVRELSPGTSRVMLTGQADLTVALEAMNKGNVFRFLEKPTSAEELKVVLTEAVELYHYFVDTQNRLRYDMLTSTYNRKTTLETLSLELERCNRYGRKLSIAMVDIDHFKVVNDTYGHIGGDQVLQKVATTISAYIRTVDLIGRYGGEEFLLIFPESELKGALSASEKIRQVVEQMQFPEYPELSVTISIGVEEYVGGTLEEFIDVADKHLYRAKNSGRNCVFTANDTIIITE